MSDNIKVVVKVRPLISREINEKLSYQWRINNNTLSLINQSGKDLGQSYTFDKVYGEDTKTTDVYNDVAKPIVEAATAGFNGTIFAYGQTSSGKTYTMTGTENSPGIIPLAVLNLFDIIKSVPNRDFLVRVSYIEIYNETVRDLLNVEKESIKIHESHQGIKVDATEKVASSPEEVLDTMREGEANREKGATNMNEESSRSHSIFQITIESREHIEGETEGGCVNVSQLNLVDLAGSERAGQTGATGKRFKEGMHINKSLSALALVIKQLSEDNKFTNYRDSKLTRILQNSLGGNAKTSIICAVTPAAAEETISTLQFANRAKAIKNKPEVNAVATDATMIQKLTKQMSKLQAQLESKKNLEQDNYNLQKQIGALQKLILNGFGQRHSLDMIGGARRKLQQPRRVTIHSTVSTMEDDPPMVNVPKFCTPTLKYNPLIPPTTDFAPIQTSNKLASVPEEPARLITPPPPKAVNFSGDVIILDSDDDSMREDHETCSPIHKCYVSSKTPPCILRKNAKRAEKDLKEIVELTEREKIFSPSAVELMEKLEENSSVITKLKDEIEVLSKESIEKDTQLDDLKDKIKKTQEEYESVCKSKLDLQAQCDIQSRKLTDWEVSYETLKNKAQLREKELLSLLDERKDKTTKDIDNILSQTLDKEIHFMDMLKDVSLVNSANENSAIENIDVLVSDTQEELSAKNQYIIETDSKLFAQKQKMESLECVNFQLEHTITTLKEKISNMESENTLLKSTIDSLNTTICNQKENLSCAHKDMESYNSLIQELQIKIRQREDLFKTNIDDSILDSMIANEEKIIANNENIMNIIISFRNALQARNKEITNLNKKINDNVEQGSKNKNLSVELQYKTEEIDKLNREVDDLKKQLNENIAIINKLMNEVKEYKLREKELSSIHHENSELQRIIRDNEVCMQDLKIKNDELVRELADKTKNLSKEIEELTTKVANSERNMTRKDDLINSLNQYKLESEDNLLKAKSAVLKSQTILSTLSGNMQEVPQIIDNFVNIFTALCDSLNTLETVASDIINEKEETKKNNDKLRADLEQYEAKYNPELKILQERVKSFDIAEKTYQKEKQDLIQVIDLLKKDLETLRIELHTTTSSKDILEAKLNDIRNAQILTSETNQNEFKEILLLKDTEINMLTKKLEAINNKLKEQDTEIDDFKEQFKKLQVDNAALLAQIHSKVIEIMNSFNVENHFSESLFDSIKIHDEILRALDIISNHITLTNLNNAEVDYNNVGEMLTEAKQEIYELNDKNQNLVEKISDVERKNSELLVKVEENKKNTEVLTNDLTNSQHLLQDLRTELQSKVMEMESMEKKLEQWKNEFENLDVIMKQQMKEMTIENEYLKSRIMNAKIDSETISVNLQNSNCKCHEGYKDEASDKKITDITNIDINSPPSLLTICCNRIVEYIEPKETVKPAISPCISDEKGSHLSHCLCAELTSELIEVKEENSRIFECLTEMEIMNKNLLEEQEVYRSEIQLLLKLSQELQKKILNHKTNMSILTATTYTENKLLQSQVKVLQHHQKRFHNVCQRDIGELKKQLSALMLVLKKDVSIYEQQNLNIKRFSLPDVLDSRPEQPNFKNESTLDGDLLMLDTNITITTVADGTLTGHDQTCMDMTQYYNEACCGTDDLDQVHHPFIQEIKSMPDSEHFTEQIIRLKGEIEMLRSQSKIKQPTVDVENSPNKSEKNYKSVSNHESKPSECINCKELTVLKDSNDKLTAELKLITEELQGIKAQSSDWEQKYKNLVLEIPSTDALVKRISIFEKEFSSQKQEIAKLNNTVNNKNKELNRLQEENDSLSNQVMDNISEVDNLNKELESLKQKNIELTDKYNQLYQSARDLETRKNQVEAVCSQCMLKEELIRAMQTKATLTHSKLNRSLSDSDTSSRYNKICTLQSELHAGREDCKVLTEDVVTIKNHLERSNMSMDLDESMDDNNIYKGLEISNTQSNKCQMPDIPEEVNSDIYKMDRIECFNYYLAKTGEKEHILHDKKIIEVMKMLYEYLITRHSMEVENLTNKLQHFEDTKILLQNVIEKHTEMCMELEVKSKKCSNIDEMLSRIRKGMNILSDDENGAHETDHEKLVLTFKDNLSLIDKELDMSTVKIFDNIVSKNQSNLLAVTENCTTLKEQLEKVNRELNSANISVTQMKSLLTAKENEYDLIKVQKEKVHEIANAVTLDIVKREKELRDTIHKGYQTLIEFDIVKSENVDTNLPLNVNINILFELLVDQSKISRSKEHEKTAVLQELNDLQSIVSEKEKEIGLLKTQCQNLQASINGVTVDLQMKESKLKELKKSYDDLNQTYCKKVDENISNVIIIDKLSKEVNILKENIADKENIIKKLEKELLTAKENKENVERVIELLETVKGLQTENNKLKSLNEQIHKEKECYAEELKKTGETIKKNNIDLDKMTSDILILRKSVKDNGDVIENLSAEAKSLLAQNKELKEQLESKSRECSRLETNIKTHEKTAQIQTKIISRLEKQRDEETKLQAEGKQKLEELKEKYLILEKNSTKYKIEIEQMKQINEVLKTRVAELEASLESNKSISVDAKSESSRRRRQSLQDSMRVIAERKHDDEEHGGVEAVFSSKPKCDDFFMDVDDQSSSRSTPIRLSRGRDSLSLSRTDHSDKDEEHSSRPSSVLETRRRRQTLHDSHRSELSQTPSQHGDGDSTVSHLREQLAACQQELEELKEKYRELDLECETCAEYYRERDEQCGKLVLEKRALQMTIKSLEEKLQANSHNGSQIKPKLIHASVNTDEDWANLHSVVVDRMSYDAEVDKNKKLTKNIEELRFKQQDLKNIIAKMQKALEKNTGRELESTKLELKKCKEELQACKQELAQLKESYKELDEECETCAQYLKEREEQCLKLKEAKAALEAKLQEVQSGHNMGQSARKKRQSVYDQNRTSSVDDIEVGTQTTEDLLQVERDSISRSSTDDKQAKEVQYLKLAVDRLLKQKEALEQQLKMVNTAVPQPAMLVATGSAIVQNQQITDIMKENQKLKKMNARLINICKKRGKESNRENEDPGLGTGLLSE